MSINSKYILLISDRNNNMMLNIDMKFFELL